MKKIIKQYELTVSWCERLLMVHDISSLLAKQLREKVEEDYGKDCYEFYNISIDIKPPYTNINKESVSEATVTLQKLPGLDELEERMEIGL